MSAPQHLWSGDWEQGLGRARRAHCAPQRTAGRGPPEEEKPPDPAAKAVVAGRRALRGVRGAEGHTGGTVRPLLGERLAALAAALGRGLLEFLRWVGLAVLALGKGLRAIVRGGWRALRRAGSDAGPAGGGRGAADRGRRGRGGGAVRLERLRERERQRPDRVRVAVARGSADRRAESRRGDGVPRFQRSRG